MCGVFQDRLGVRSRLMRYTEVRTTAAQKLVGTLEVSKRECVIEAIWRCLRFVRSFFFRRARTRETLNSTKSDTKVSEISINIQCYCHSEGI